MITRKSKEAFDEALEIKILGHPFTFGGAVEALRMGKELSQIDVAKKLDISPQYLCDVEKGRKLVSVDQAVRFAKVFKHSKSVFVRLALQDQVRKSKLKLRVTLHAI